MNKRLSRLVAAAATAALLATSACGGDEQTASTGKILLVSMTDNAFDPLRFSVAEGETVTFAFRNEGTVTHEAFIGDAEAQRGHAEEMKRGKGDADHQHGDSDSDSDSVEVAPGKTARLTHTFRRGETIEIGCHVPGHYESGMKMIIEVT